MAVTVLTTPTSATAVAPASPYTGATHTVDAGSDRLLLVCIGIGDGTSRLPTGAVTYGGQAMTQIGTGADNANWVGASAWYLDEAGIAAAGSTTISVVHAAEQIGVGAVALAGVDQTTPIDTGGVQTSAGSGTSASVTIASASDNLVVATVMSDQEGGITENQTLLYETAAISNDTIAAAQYDPGAASVALTWTQTSEGFAVIGWEVNAAAGEEPPPGIPFFTTLGSQRL